MLPVEENTRRKEAVITFHPQGEHVSLLEPRGFLREAPVCKKLIPKLVPIRPIFLPQHGSSMTCDHGTASTCYGQNFVSFGAGLGISFSHTRAFDNKPHGYSRERFTFVDEMISVASS